MIPLSTAAPDPVRYLDTAAATPIGTDYKRRFVDALDLRPGHVVVDIGCGPGTDLSRLADAVGPTGRVIGLDRDPRMVGESRRRFADRAGVDVCTGDGHALPLADACVDRVRADRVLMHVPDPGGMLAEARRVLRPGGLLGLVEPDWDTLAVDDEDVPASRAFARFVAGGVRNPTIGRELVRLAARAGFTNRAVQPIPVVFQDVHVADEILGLRRNAARAIEAGVLAPEAVRSWLARLTTGPFLAGFTCYLVTAEA